jgi:hypothetical protein
MLGREAQLDARRASSLSVFAVEVAVEPGVVGAESGPQSRAPRLLGDLSTWIFTMISSRPMCNDPWCSSAATPMLRCRFEP